MQPLQVYYLLSSLLFVACGVWMILRPLTFQKYASFGQRARPESVSRGLRIRTQVGGWFILALAIVVFVLVVAGVL